jgi:hypothetical protein
VSLIQAERWQGGQTGLTLSYSVQVLPSVPQELRDAFPLTAQRATGLWTSAIDTHGVTPFLRFLRANSFGQADVQITVGGSGPGTKAAEAQHFYATHASGRRVIERAEIGVYPASFAEAIGRLRSGRLTQGQFDALLARTLAHEICHVLGIQGHSTQREDIMNPTNDATTMFQTSITAADVNTLSHLYCGSGAPVQQQAAAQPASTPFAAMAGRWECRVSIPGQDVLAYDGFVLHDDGSLSLLGVVGEKATVSGSVLRFEQTDDSGFYGKRTFQFTLVSGQLRGTKTETSGTMFPRPTETHGYICNRAR